VPASSSRSVDTALVRCLSKQSVDPIGPLTDGAKFHTAWFGPDGLHVLDLWDTGQQFQRFTETRLMPAVQKIGIKGQPKVELTEAHAVFAPNV
jgi:hypothetical protein